MLTNANLAIGGAGLLTLRWQAPEPTAHPRSNYVQGED